MVHWNGVLGFGKTRAAIKIINLLRRNDRTRKVIIVVPRIPLKAQWEEELRKVGQLQHTEVFVINTLIQRRQIECSLLVLDEIHRDAANTFSRVFNVVKYSFILGLTATLDRLDGKHELLKKYAPVCHRVTLREARLNKWVATTTVYNLGLEMIPEEREEYNRISSEFQKYFGKFDNDFDLMKKCAGKCVPKKLIIEGREVYLEPYAVKRARQLGWVGNSAEIAYRIEQSNRARSEKHNIWGGPLSHPYHPDKLQVFAIQGMRMMGKMKQAMYKSGTKVLAAEQILRSLPEDVKAITFGEVCEVADLLANSLGEQAVAYHSQLETIVRNGKKFSATRQKLEAIQKLKDGRARYAISAKALDEGADFPDLTWGIITSFTSSPTQRIQREGRVGRKFTFANGEEKEAVVVWIYLKDTKEYYWLNKAQKKDPSVIWVDSVFEILLQEGLLTVEETGDNPVNHV